MDDGKAQISDKQLCISSNRLRLGENFALKIGEWAGLDDDCGAPRAFYRLFVGIQSKKTGIFLLLGA